MIKISTKLDPTRVSLATSHSMYNVNNYEYDCTRKCKCDLHGQQITAALTKRAIVNDRLAAYIAKTCCNFANITDPRGRSAAHIAASVDRYAILEWLLNRGSAIDRKDLESGSTALHRAIYYGCIDCAVLLVRYGASLDQLDDDTRSALQNCCRFCDIPRYRNTVPNNELLVWGLNKNYNLGLGDEEGASAPQFIDFFRKERISIMMASLSHYHSLFVDIKGHLYAAGHGKGGRLGNGKELSLPTPRRVKVPIKNACERIICVSTSRKHSLVLTDRSAVFACGLNEDMQMGIANAPEKLTVFKEVVKLRDFGVENLNRVIARDFHSIAYSRKLLYIWGTNHGQFGWNTATQKVIPLPKLVKLPETERLDFVESNNFAIVCNTLSHNIILLYNYKVRHIKPPEFESVKSISIAGGDNTKATKGTPAALKLLMVTRSNVMFIWHELSQQFLQCFFTHIQVTEIDKIFYKANQVMILSGGDVYTGKCHQVPTPVYEPKSSSTWIQGSLTCKDICTNQKIRIELNRMPQVDRAVDIFCDDDFNSFAVIQESCYKYYKVCDLSREEYSFKKLLFDANENDEIHDIVFHVDGKVFYAHKFLIFSRSPGLKEIVLSRQMGKDVYLDYDLFTATMFELILKHIYANYFITYDDIRLIDDSLGPECPFEGPLNLFLTYVQKFQLSNLASHILSGGVLSITDKSKYKWHLKRTDYQHLYDVKIRCAGDVEIPAHKCVLVSQLEYFDLMFANTWAERSVVNLTTVPAEYMIPILDFLYTLDADHFRKQNYSEAFLYNMIVFCDQFFIERLRKVCENLILEKINIRKCGEVLEFACIYNCDLLKTGCLDFICQNLYRVLSQRSLEGCQPEVLSCLNNHYRKMFKQVFDYRLITPDSDAVNDETLLSFVQDFEVDLEYKLSDEDLLKSHIKKKSKQVGSLSEQKKRQYEQDAINLMKKLNLQDSETEHSSEKGKMLKEAKEASETTENLSADSWMKVADKKESKKNPSILAALKVNEIIKDQPKPKDVFTTLGLVVESCSSTESSPTKGDVLNFNLGDFTPYKSEKLSQKQRKRLSAETSRSEQHPTSTRAASIQSHPQPIPNAWGISSPSQSSDSDFSYALRSPSNHLSDSPTKRMGAGPSSSAASSTNTSFSQILDDERKQRDYVDRLKNKSLALTQIEETAIAELRQFYNVDNVDDEIITIERKKCPFTVNFAVWQRN